MAVCDEVWLLDFGDPYPGEPAHRRPAIVVGPSAAWEASLPMVVVVPLTTTRRGLPHLHVEVEPDVANGLDEVSYARCDLLRAVSTRRLVHRVGVVSGETAFAIEIGVRDLLGY